MNARQDAGELTAAVKRLARQHGAALVGVAPVERFDPMPPLFDAVPKGHHPRDFIPEAQSVISIAQPILDPVLDAPARLAERDLEMIPDHVKRPYMEILYGRMGHGLQDYALEFIGQMVGQYLLTQGHQTMIFPTAGLHPAVSGMTEREIWQGHTPFNDPFGPFSHRHAATRAGLGEFGYANVVLTREFGLRQRFNSIITDAELVGDPLISEPICRRDACRLCQEACPMGCISMRDDPSVVDYRSVDKVDRGTIFIDTPARTNPTVCRRRREGGADRPLYGECIRVCPVPQVRPHQSDRLKALIERRKG